jgi:hypothetical protein
MQRITRVLIILKSCSWYGVSQSGSNEEVSMLVMDMLHRADDWFRSTKKRWCEVQVMAGTDVVDTRTRKGRPV